MFVSCLHQNTRNGAVEGTTELPIRSWGARVWDPGVAGLCPLPRLQGGSFRPLPAPEGPGVLDLWPHLPVSASFMWLLHVWVPPLLSLIRTLVIGFRSNLDIPRCSSICEDPSIHIGSHPQVPGIRTWTQLWRGGHHSTTSGNEQHREQ